MSDQLLAQILGGAQTKAVHQALKPHLRAAGVGAVEERIGKSRRFFENVRHRGSLRLKDFLATCAVLDLDPVELVKEALDDRIVPGVRPPLIVSAAWKRLRDDGPGLGEERMAELEAAVQAQPRKARSALTRELPGASREQLPQLLGLCASAFRVESDLARAELMLRHAREIARTLELRDAEPDLLIRMAYLALERDRLPNALRWAREGTLGHARLGDREGQGRGFRTIGMLRYYTGEYGEAIYEVEAALAKLADPLRRLAAHQLLGVCHAAMGAENEARDELAEARALATDAPRWMLGKLTWLEARLERSSRRLDLLQVAKEDLRPARPTDCALLSIELIEEALAMEHQELAEQEVFGLCALLERNLSPRIEKAIARLIRNRDMLTPPLVAQIRRSVEKGHSRRLATLVSSDLE